jgi:hypothetical protein
VKRLLAFVVGAFGVRALLRRRRGAPPPADALREKLADRRAVEPEPAPAAPQAEEPIPAPGRDAAPEPDSVDERRADVHARARRQIDELSGS